MNQIQRFIVALIFVLVLFGFVRFISVDLQDVTGQSAQPARDVVFNPSGTSGLKLPSLLTAGRTPTHDWAPLWLLGRPDDNAPVSAKRQPPLYLKLCCEIGTRQRDYRGEFQDLCFMERAKLKSHFTNEAVLKRETTLVKEVLLGKITQDSVRTAEEQSPCIRKDTTYRIVFCAFVPPQHNKIAAEWVVYHWILGVRSFILQDNDPEYPLSVALKPLIDKGVVEVVSVATDKEIFPMQLNEASFLNECRLRVAAKDPTAVISGLQVDNFVVITRLSSSTEGQYSCIDEVVLSSRSGASGFMTVIPSVAVGHYDHWYDNHRTPFEHTSFSTGNTGEVVSTLERVRNGMPLVSPGDGSYHLFTSAAFLPGQLQHGFVPTFATGHLINDRTVSLAEVALTARVLRFFRTLEGSINDAVESCWRFVKHPTDRCEQPAVFELGDVFWDWRNHIEVFDDLPKESSLKATQFLALHAVVLRALGFSVDRRTRNFYSEELHHKDRNIVDVLSQILEKPELAAHGVTNGQLVRGEVQLKKEGLLHPLNMAKIHHFRKHGTCMLESAQLGINITMCALVRNRAKLTVEWVLHHLLLGVGRFIIFNDDSTDSIDVDLQPLVDIGLVVIVPSEKDGPYRFKSRPVKGPLLHSYGDCLTMEERRFALEAHASMPWVGLLDSDEFVMLPTGECLPRFVVDLVAMQKFVGAVAIPWREVGHGRKDFFDNHITQLYRTAFSTGHEDKTDRVKNIVRADLGTGMLTAHRVDLKHPYVTVFANGKTLTSGGWFSGFKESSTNYKRAQVYHYHARSLSSWLRRFLDGFADDNDRIWRFDVSQLYYRWLGSTEERLDVEDIRQRAASEFFNTMPMLKERYRALLSMLGVEPPYEI